MSREMTAAGFEPVSLNLRVRAWTGHSVLVADSTGQEGWIARDQVEFPEPLRQGVTITVSVPAGIVKRAGFT